MQPQGQGRTSSGKWFQRQYLLNFIDTLYEGDLHAKRVLSLANATLGVLTSASLAIHAAGRGLAQAMGTLTKHGVKQVDRMLSNRGVDVWTFFYGTAVDASQHDRAGTQLPWADSSPAFRFTWLAALSDRTADFVQTSYSLAARQAPLSDLLG